MSISAVYAWPLPEATSTTVVIEICTACGQPAVDDLYRQTRNKLPCVLQLQLQFHVQWRSQSAADARAQHGHKPRTQAPPSFQRLAVRKCRSNYGGLGDAPPENFGIFELPRSILGLL